MSNLAYNHLLIHLIVTQKRGLKGKKLLKTQEIQQIKICLICQTIIKDRKYA